MQTTWLGANTAHEVAIQAVMQRAIDDFDALGTTAHRSCEMRRAWLLTQVSAAWLATEYGPHTGILTIQQATQELSTQFIAFLPLAAIRICFVVGPIQGLHPKAPMGTWPSGQVDVCSANITSQLIALGLSVRQLTFHELIHVSGDIAPAVPLACDNIPRMNWAGVGALMRATQQRRVDVADGRPAAG
jgi:hypothetical protein